MEDRFKGISAETIKEKIKKRQLLIEKIVEFTNKIIIEVGEIKSKNVGSSHTHIKSELVGFGGFSFFSNAGQTMMGVMI